MGIENAKHGKLLYHLTKLSNLDSILKYGLLSRQQLLASNLCFGDIANEDIISKRGLDSYVPFHFHPYSPFDFAVKRSYPDEAFIYLCLQKTMARQNNFGIFPSHPLSSTRLSYEEGINAINWDALMTLGSNDHVDKQAKMAECVSSSAVPASWFQSIAVKDEKMKEKVSVIFKDNNFNFPPPHINIQREWF